MNFQLLVNTILEQQAEDRSYYNSYLTNKERIFIDKITDISLQKLKTLSKCITLKEIENAFNETFFPDYNSNDYIYELFDECATNALTKTGGVIYNQLYFREAGTDEEIKQRIKNSIAYDLKRWFTYYENGKLNTNQSKSEKLIKTYVDSRRFQNITTRLPELKGMFD